MTPLEQARHIVTTYSGIVAEFVSRGRVPRELTREEKRLAVDDVAAFEKTVATIQREQLDLMRDEAILDVAREDLERLEAEDRTRRHHELTEKRHALLCNRYESALEVDGCLNDMEQALTEFQSINAQISLIDRQLGEPDANRASLGLVSMSLRHAIYQFAPTLFKALGAKLPFSGNGSRRTLSDTFAVAGYEAWSSKTQKED